MRKSRSVSAVLAAIFGAGVALAPNASADTVIDVDYSSYTNGNVAATAHYFSDGRWHRVYDPKGEIIIDNAILRRGEHAEIHVYSPYGVQTTCRASSVSHADFVHGEKWHSNKVSCVFDPHNWPNN